VDIWTFRILIVVIVAICLLPLAAGHGALLIAQSLGPFGRMQGAMLAYIFHAGLVLSYWTVPLMQITLLVWAVTEIVRLIQKLAAKIT
jgi:hypothetical protein